MPDRTRIYVRFLVVFALLGGTGLAATVYLLIMQRAPLPLRDVYVVNAEFSAANGIVKGIGQPVNVAGVKIGQVVGVETVDGRALVKLELKRDKIARVYADASATLEPITPLKDMQINLDPGRPPAPALRANATLRVARTNAPVPLSDLLSSLDTDTRTFLAGMIASLDLGTRERAPDIRRVMLAMGPTTAQAGRISRALAGRRRELARLVHNLAVVTTAASRDDRLADVVASGNQTLEALAEQEVPLRQAIAKLPATLEVTRSTLVHLKPFARDLGPTLTALVPPTRRLPAMFAALRPFADTTSAALKRDIRPFVKDTVPLIRQAAPAVEDLADATPNLSRAFQVLNYTVNELAYNPPGNDEGFLFWASWFVHNWNSILSLGDAHGGIGRATVTASCVGLQGLKELQDGFRLLGICPE